MKNKNVIVLVVVGIMSILLVGMIYKGITIKKSTDKNSVTITPTVTKEMTPTETPVLAYSSTSAKLQFKFKTAMYVFEQVPTKDDTVGSIYISTHPVVAVEIPTGLNITYESPVIDGKGGACDEKIGWKTMRVLGQNLTVCEIGFQIGGGYLKNPNYKIEYAFSIDDSNKLARKFAPGEYTLYKDVLYNRISFLK